MNDIITGGIVGVIITLTLVAIFYWSHLVSVKRELKEINTALTNTAAWNANPKTHATRILQLCNKTGFNNQSAILNYAFFDLYEESSRIFVTKTIKELESVTFLGSKKDIEAFYNRYEEALSAIHSCNYNAETYQIQYRALQNTVRLFLIQVFEKNSNYPILYDSRPIHAIQEAVDLLSITGLAKNYSYDFNNLQQSNKEVLEILRGADLPKSEAASS